MNQHHAKCLFCCNIWLLFVKNILQVEKPLEVAPTTLRVVSLIYSFQFKSAFRKRFWKCFSQFHAFTLIQPKMEHLPSVTLNIDL